MGAVVLWRGPSQGAMVQGTRVADGVRLKDGDDDIMAPAGVWGRPMGLRGEGMNTSRKWMMDLGKLRVMHCQ